LFVAQPAISTAAISERDLLFKTIIFSPLQKRAGKFSVHDFGCGFSTFRLNP